ncbi:MAG: bifunctional riboflavin kinase/FAD synthetase [Chitinophagaceae bacterium]|nr:MAG: bifunctional riboflavin kinase/FAD synthetase [Chitinophagaceae bacterium]
MNVHSNINALPEFHKAVITIGTFDGVHKGHQKIIQQLVKEADAINGTPVLITFFPHPKQIVSSGKNPLYILNTPEEKYALLQQQGILHIVVVPFNKEFAEQTAADYIDQFLVKRFHPHTIIIGYDHRFGNNRQGDYQLLEKEAAQHGYIVKEIPEHVLQDVTISSTKVRTALLAGDLSTAENYLGYKYFFTGKVVQGNQLGRTIGYPTANLQIENEQKLVPANGVYAVSITIKNRQGSWKGMMNIGVRPTVDGTKRVIEVNIFDFDEMIYGLELTVTMHTQLRQEVKFNGLEELKAQLAQDKLNATQALKTS